MRIRGRNRLAAIIVVLGVAAAACLPTPPPAPTDPLSWSSPVMVDSAPPLGNAGHLQGVSCPTTALCVAGDGGGNLLVSTNPTGDATAWPRAFVDPGSWIASVS